MLTSSIRIKLDPFKPQLSSEEKAALQANVQLLRDAIVLFTATGAARGVSGHTGQYSFSSSQCRWGAWVWVYASLTIHFLLYFDSRWCI